MTGRLSGCDGRRIGGRRSECLEPGVSAATSRSRRSDSPEGVGAGARFPAYSAHCLYSSSEEYIGQMTSVAAAPCAQPSMLWNLEIAPS